LIQVKKKLTVVEADDDKETLHFELDLGESGLKYIVGDSLGVLPLNCPNEVNDVIQALNLPADYQLDAPSWKYPNQVG
jgi:sulfite reductase alpha subunit-like flavoprotein